MALAQVLREYGQAFRGDWSPSTIDGRTVRDEMSEMREEMEVVHQKIDGLSVLLTMLAGAAVEIEDSAASLMDEIGEDNPQ